MRQVRISEDFVPLSELKARPSAVLKRLADFKHSIVITQHGRPAAVLLAPEEFDRLHERIRFLESVREGLSDFEAGRVVSDAELGRELDEEFAEKRSA